MIIDFTISNFRSINEAQTLSFEAMPDKHLEEYFVVTIGKYRLLKMAIILGANASGKSNILEAFYMLPKLMLSPCKDKTSAINYDRFLLDKEKREGKSSIEVNFIVNELRYKYSVAFDNSVVYDEVLKCQPFDAYKEHMVFERMTDASSLLSSMKWGEKYRSVVNTRIISGNLLHNRTVFGAYLNSNVKIPWMKDILDWMNSFFMPMINISDQNLTTYVSNNIVENIINKADVEKLIVKADVGIHAIDVKRKKELLDKDFVEFLLHNDDVPEKLKNRVKEDPTNTSYEVKLFHAGHQGEVPFDFRQESNGTKRYYELSGVLIELIKEPHFLTIDELECQLHPDLYMHFITTYLRNSSASQIVFTTHMREFLADRDTFRDDCVWITEKSEKGDTSLYSLADFDTDTLRSSSSRYNAYRAGRLGGIPALGDTYVEISK